MPPQPAGIWNSVYNDAKWTDATGPDRYRRAIYTFVKRTAGYPSSLMFDASDRDTSLPRRIATNTPLQALVDHGRHKAVPFQVSATEKHTHPQL